MREVNPRTRSAKREAILVSRRRNCAIVCAAVIGCAADADTKRRALAALVRHATPKGVQRPGDLRTAGVAALDDSTLTTRPIHHEHVVPVRLIVDRMLTGDDPSALLDVAVVAHVLADEHRHIGPLVTVHAELYEQMKVAELSQLAALARRRYSDRGLELTVVPYVIEHSDELNDVDGGP